MSNQTEINLNSLKVGTVVTVGQPRRTNVSTYKLCPFQYKTKNGRKVYVEGDSLPGCDPAVRARIDAGAAVHAMVVGLSDGRIAERIYNRRQPDKEWKVWRQLHKFVKVQVQGGSGRAFWVRGADVGLRQEKVEGNILFIKSGGWRKPNVYFLNGEEIGSEVPEKVRKVAIDRSGDSEDLVSFILPGATASWGEGRRIEEKKQQYIELYRTFIKEVHTVDVTLEDSKDYWPHWWDLPKKEESA